MGYALLWIENLAVALLFVATMVAWLCRVPRRPDWAWIDWLAYPVVGVLAVCASAVTWLALVGHRAERGFDPFVLIAPVLLVALLLWLLFRAWQERASIRSWGVRVLALAATYLGMIGTAVYVRTSYATSTAWFFVVLMPLLVLTFVAAWLVLRGQRWCTKAELLLLIVAFPFVAAVNIAVPVPPWFYEVLIATVLLVAAPAWFLRDGRSYWPRVVLAALAFLLPLAVYGLAVFGVVTVGARYSAFKNAVPDMLVYALAALTILFAIGGIWVLLAGLRRRGDDPHRAAAAAWPRGKLAIAFAVAVALNLMTFWNLDLGVRQRLETLRAEASALALSVAPPRVPDDENAAFLYDQALDAMGPTANRRAAWSEEGFQWPNEPDDKFDPTSPKLRSFLENHASTLRLLHEAAKRPACCFERDYGRPSVNMLLPEPDQLHYAMALLAADARCKAAAGDLGAALEDVNAMFAQAKHVSAEPLPILIGIAIWMDTSAQETLQVVIDSKRPAAPELARIDIPNQPSYLHMLRRAFRMGEAFGLSAFADVGTGQDGFRILLGSDAAAFPWQMESIVLPLYRVFLLNHDLAGYRRIVERNHLHTNSPYWQTKSYWEELDLKDNLPNSQSVITKLVVTPGSAFAKAAASGDARRGLARLALAACRYRAAHDRLPDKAEDLLPEFIPAVPSDPFDGKSLKWKRTDGGGLVLYSIGPDMSDDGGNPFDKENQTGDFTFELAP